MIRLLLSITLLLSSHVSFAETEEELSSIPTGEQGTVVTSTGVELQEITLLGEGISPRWSKKELSLFFACTGTKIKCSKVRAVLFDQKNNTASWVGADLELLSAADVEKITNETAERKIIHQKMKKYARYFHRYYKRGDKIVGPIFLGEGLGIFVGMPMLAQTTLVAASAIMPIAFGIFVVGGVTMVIAATNTLNLGTSSKYSNALQSQEGWNWSARSRKVSNQIFYQYVNYAQKGYPVRLRSKRISRAKTFLGKVSP